MNRLFPCCFGPLKPDALEFSTTFSHRNSPRDPELSTKLKAIRKTLHKNYSNRVLNPQRPYALVEPTALTDFIPLYKSSNGIFSDGGVSIEVNYSPVT